MKTNPAPPALFAGLCSLSGVAVLSVLTAFADANPNAHGRTSPILKVGDSWSYDSGLKVTFVEVVSDTRRYPELRPAGNRRPDDAPRTTGRRVRGNAVVALVVEVGDEPPQTVRIHTHRDPKELVIPADDLPPGMAGIPKSYLVSIRKLLPEASKRGGLRPQRLYRLRLNVDLAV